MKLPDVLVVVLDCVRAQDFDPSTARAGGLVTARRLAGDSLVCTRALSPASWTVPSHASMFTGLDPWEHRLIKGGEAHLAPSIPTLAESLAARGYRTGLFSANPLIAGENGLARGFDTHRLGSFVDCFFRSTVSRHPNLARSTSSVPGGPAGEPTHGTSKVRKRALSSFFGSLERWPLLSDTTDRALGRIPDGHPGADHGGWSVTAPWIEESLSRWLSRIPKDQPSYTFVNLLDAHEPYLGVTRGPENRRTLWNRLRFRQDGIGADGGEGLWTDEQRTAMTMLYRRCIDLIDVRLGLLLDLIRQHRDWDNTLVIVTGDHGQAFGEEGSIYHMFGISSSLHRVPLIVKPAGSDRSRSSFSEWVSTRALYRLVLDAVSEGATTTSGLDGALSTLQEFSQAPAMSFSDVNLRDSLGSNRLVESRKRPDRYIVVYRDGTKLAVNVESGKQSQIDMGRQSAAPYAPDTSRPDVAATIDSALTVANIVRRTSGSTSVGPLTISDRLRTWGYG